jgi:hypothetical protein
MSDYNVFHCRTVLELGPQEQRAVQREEGAHEPPAHHSPLITAVLVSEDPELWQVKKGLTCRADMSQGSWYSLSAQNCGNRLKI